MLLPDHRKLGKAERKSGIRKIKQLLLRECCYILTYWSVSGRPSFRFCFRADYTPLSLVVADCEKNNHFHALDLRVEKSLNY